MLIKRFKMKLGTKILCPGFRGDSFVFGISWHRDA